MKKSVYASDKDLNALLGIISQRTIEEHKKMIAHKRGEINKKLEFIPARIDEVRRGMADTRELDASVIQKQIAGEQQRIMEANDELYEIQNGGAIQEKKQLVKEIDWKLKEGQQKHLEKTYTATEGIRERQAENRSKVQDIRNEQGKLNSEWNTKMHQQEQWARKVKTLLDDWNIANKSTFDTHATTCPTCSQDLPQEQIEKAIERFNLNKSNQLERITKEGKEAAAKRDKLREEVNELDEKIAKLKEKEVELLNEGASIQDEITKAKLQLEKYEDTPEYAEFIRMKSKLNTEIQQLQQNASSAAEEVQKRIYNMKQTVFEHQENLAKFSRNEQSQKRIAELEQEEKELAAMFEKIEQELFLIEEFTRSKVNLLEDKINSKFQHARFKLFEEQINGGLVDTCKTLYKGVPYSEGLNNGARINVGLDIIQTLSRHFNIQVPIFVDNAEAVTKMIPIENQVVSLIVSEGDKELRVV